MNLELHVSYHKWDSLEPKIKRIENSYVKPKPGTGFWTSTYIPNGKHASAWLRWCCGENFRTHIKYGYFCEPWKNARVLTIDSLEDFVKILFIYKYVDNEFSRYREILDYEVISSEYDCIHLTENGQWETHMSDPTLYGWDCESILWFRKTFDVVDVLEENLVKCDWKCGVWDWD